MTSESSIKRYIVDSMHEGGGYARRFEDQYTVGTYDMILIPFGLPAFFTEVKIIRDHVFSPTSRQAIELQRINDVAGQSGHVIPLMIGWREGVFYFSRPKIRINRIDCFSVTTSDMPFYKQLTLYYYSQKDSRNES